MFRYILAVDGMMCGHCEAHMNDTIRNNFSVKSVESSHSKNQCVIIADEIDESELAKAVASTGYELKGISKEPYVKKGIFRKSKK